MCLLASASVVGDVVDRLELELALDDVVAALVAVSCSAVGTVLLDDDEDDEEAAGAASLPRGDSAMPTTTTSSTSANNLVVDMLKPFVCRRLLPQLLSLILSQLESSECGCDTHTLSAHG